ncbi:Membrane protein-like protein [[Clostridium] ultunense Esp]|uniref:Membrane protein-like protein n=2 Tax=Schnuerera ultunensis TaxID=45497 RepID=M1ZFU7_9FIRM|nr:Membrane protein-like protein [[Clostridium] ultunense Esp]SHD78293.1 Membrane protein-like protein [[Clostridium] ultunense Esp]
MIPIKKYLKVSTIILLVLLILINFPLNGKAEESLSISRWLIDSEIKENGDLMVQEDITFNFNDEFNGVYRDIILTGTEGLENLQVSEMVKGKKILYSRVNEAKNGDSNVFMTINNGDSVNIKIFSPSKYEEKAFRLSYIIKNVAVKYKDTGELYYKFLGKENSTAIGFFAVNIKLPQPKNDKVKIFAHGPSNGAIRFKEDNLIRIEVENISKNNFVEARVLFPTNFIPNSTKVVDNNAYDGIIEEELSYIKEIEEKQIRRERNKSLFNNLSIIIAGIGVVAIAFIFSRLRRDIDIYDTIDHNLYPDDCTPAVATYLTNSGLNTTTIMATIFDLARKGHLSIEDKGEYEKKTNNFKLEKLEKSVNSLLSHESFLLDWLFNEIGDTKTVTTKDIEYYGKKHRTEFGNSYNTWQKKVKKDAKNKGFYDDDGKKLGGLLIAFYIIAFPFSIIAINFGGFYGIVLLFVSVFTFIYGMVIIFRKSDYGYIQYKKWQDFKKDLKLRGDTLNVENLSFPLESALIYGLALRVNINTLKKFRKLIPKSSMPNHWAYWCYTTGARGQNSFERSLNKSFSAGSSSTGSGGGFSGGGGGGAGGGGAGGF